MSDNQESKTIQFTDEQKELFEKSFEASKALLQAREDFFNNLAVSFGFKDMNDMHAQNYQIDVEDDKCSATLHRMENYGTSIIEQLFGAITDETGIVGEGAGQEDSEKA